MILRMYNNSSHLSSGCTSFSLVDIDVVVACLFLVLFPVALLLNGMALWVSLHLKSLSTFIVYLKNLLMADLLMTMTMPLMAASMLPGATSELKAFTCRYNSVVFYTSMYTSITLMGLISLDRFFKIVQPCGKVLGQNVMFSAIVCSVVWVALFGGTAFPNFILTDQAPNNRSASFCMALKSPAGTTLHNYVVALMELLFWLVCFLVVFCYSCITLKVLKSFRNSGSNNRQGKKKTNRRVFLILLVFFVCFAPLHFLRVPHTLDQMFHISVCRQKWVLILHKLSVWVASSNACLDPFLYIYLCKDYREKLIDLMKGCGIAVQQEQNKKSPI